MTKEEKVRKIAENMRKHTERYGFPTRPNPKKAQNKKK